VVVLITGAAPYLGGPHTWKPLRDAAPEITFVEIDALVVAGDRNMELHVREAVEAALRDADGIVAHGGVCRVVLEAVARVRSDMPVLLLSPMMVQRRTTFVRVARVVFGSPIVQSMLTRFARSKLRKLRANRGYVRRQLGFFVRRDLISDALVDEALARLRDPRSTAIVDRTAEFLMSALVQLDPAVDSAVRNRRTLVGGDMSDRRMASRTGATVLPNANGSPMIEEPQTVAAVMRELLSARQ
jgi:hypothetical protein